MTTLISILAQTSTGAIIQIIILLLVAGLIAYLTAYFYYKPIYLRKIEALEDEKKDLQRQVSGLQNDLSDLVKEVAELKKKLEPKKK